ncbi:Tic20 family protein [Synechococcus sp. PCC 7336]|uniref:Tic20 family protein n=1 Tax=Synechococcus sp. PCC 7336 TaxID=195250 RepID=UPI0003470369|nr:Tic20 family protein [Synechococcus sp. PCC 7336]
MIGNRNPLRDRLFISLPYLLLLLLAVPFSRPLFAPLPWLGRLLRPWIALTAGWVGSLWVFVVLLLLYRFVVHNRKIQHAIRYNVAQVVFAGIALLIAKLVLRLGLTLLGAGVRVLGAIADVMSVIVFLGAVAIAIYCIAENWRGRYPRVPTLSSAARIVTSG